VALFQISILQNYLQNLDFKSMQKSYDKYQNIFVPKIENIKKSKEEQYQYGFLDDLFVKILGYDLNPSPDYNLTAEQKNETNNKKADGAIIKDDKIIAVIELKSTKLKSMESIVNQAFSYKNNHPYCKYIITSNFEKLRFYIEYSDKFIEFNLFKMDKVEFKKLYALLCKVSIFDDTPLLLKEKSKLQEENISNELYKKYANLRKNLFANIVRNNPTIDKLTLLSKTGKLLDRMVFIFFAEDRGILPTNTISTIVEYYKNDIEDRDLYHFYKIYFDAINSGNAKLKISAYNGGLFTEDEMIDSLKIDDDVLDKLPLELSAYDFNSDIDVNILGHIFENSLSDIEEIRASIEGKEFDKAKSKRKKDGVFYTPEYITKYIVDNTLGKLCFDKKKELKLNNIEIEIPKNPKKLNKSEAKLKEALENYREFLLNLKILDPACGSGAFLNQALNHLLDEHNFIDESMKILMGGDILGLYDVKKSILENNLYGVDINPEAVEIAKLSLWLRTVEHGRKLNILSQKIKAGNSLIDDKSVAKDAFVWKEEFKEVFEQGGFDCVIGNPPYGAFFDKTEKDFFLKNYDVTEYNFDSYNFFFELSLKLLTTGSYLGFITPNTFLVVENGLLLRELLFKQNHVIELYEIFSVFPDAVVEPIISIVQKCIPHKNSIFKVILGSRDKSHTQEQFFLNQYVIKKNKLIFNYRETGYEQKLYEKILLSSVALSAIANVTTGTKPYQTGKGSPKQTKEIVQEKPFTGFEKHDGWYPLVRGTQVRRYLVDWDGEYIKYGKWLAEPRKPEIFFEPKLFIRRTDDKLLCSYDDKNFIGLNSIHCIQSFDIKVSNKYLLGLINSKLLNWFFQHENFHMVGKPLAEVKVVYIERLPIKKVLSNEQNIFIEKVDAMSDLNQKFNIKKQKFLKRIKSNFNIEKFSKKLDTFYNFDFKTFLKELKKKKVTLTLKEQDEWEEYFENYQKELLEIKAEIEKTDNEIDDMVYELYGLNDVEISIVNEGKNNVQ
jgi:type I restriction-modification system DNA methylase subunit